MAIREAACSCGKLTLTAGGEPVRISVCHCLSCQRRTGSTFGMQARFRARDVEIRGQSTEFVRQADSGNSVSFHFCADCGSTVYYRISDLPDHIGVPVGAFADPSFPAPTVSVYESHRHKWMPLPDRIEHGD